MITFKMNPTNFPPIHKNSTTGETCALTASCACAPHNVEGACGMRSEEKDHYNIVCKCER